MIALMFSMIQCFVKKNSEDIKITITKKQIYLFTVLSIL